MSGSNVADVIGRFAAETPDAPAVIDRGRTISYREFDAAVWRAASWLIARGVEPGQVVGLALGNTALHLAAAYALARMGAVQVSLAQREAPAVRAALAKRFGVRHVLAEAAPAGVPGLPRLEPDPSWLDSSRLPAATLRAPGGDAPWKIVMSSGTTGQPKAVLQPHAVHLAWRQIGQRAIPLDTSDRYLALVGLDFIAGLRSCMEVHWAGATVILEDAPTTAAAALIALEKSQATFAYLLPPHLEQLLAVSPAPGPHFPRLRLRAGGMVIREALRREVRRRLAPRFIVVYGTNDLGSPIAIAQGETLDRFPGSLGFPVEGVEVQVVDDADRVLPAGGEGHVRVRAPRMPPGYLDTGQGAPSGLRNGWYYPGDRCQFDAHGVLYWRGRVDDLMNYDGFKIYPGEIEDVLYAHPDVEDAVAFPLGSNAHQNIPCAAVVSRGADADELRRFCAEAIGVRAPHHVIVLPALPRNATGKVDRREIARQLAERLHRGH